MALTKSSASHLSGQTSTTATPTGTSIADAYRASAYIEIVVVGTATTGALVYVEVSVDNTDWYRLAELQAGLAAGTYEWVVQLPDDAQYVRTPYTAQSGGTSSTLDVQIGKVTAY